MIGIRPSLAVGLPVLLVLGCLPAAADPPPLHYVERSTGLEEPTWEGGDSELEFADVDGDGNPDIVSIGDHGNPEIQSTERGIMTWFGDGAGSWSYVHAGNLGYGGCALGDVNGDGILDIAYGMHHAYGSGDLGDQYEEVALGDGTGLSWAPWDDGLADEGQSWGMFATDLGDIDGDGDLDVGASGFGSSDGMHAWLNDGDGTWRRSFGFLGGNSGQVFAFGDVDGDGILDIATAKQEGTVWAGDGEGFFTVADGNLPSPGEWNWYDGPSLGDLDRDGRDDLAYCDTAGNPRAWLSRGRGTWEDAGAGLPSLGDCRYTALEDVDADGTIDLVTFGGGWVHVFRRTGPGGTWQEATAFQVPDNPGSARAFRTGADFDHNGRMDMVTLAEDRTDPWTKRNHLRAWAEATPPATLRVRLLHPGPHRRLLAGQVRFVRWITEVPAGETARIRLELSTTGPGGPWETIADDLPDNGRFQWLVPDRLSADCRIRVTATTPTAQVTTVGDGSFEIARRPDPLVLRFEDKETLAWDDTLDRDRWNLYRGDWGHFRATGELTQDPDEVPGAARWCDLAARSATDPYVPAPGTMVYWLVTGYRLVEDGQEPGTKVPLAEGTLGQDSAARMRRNAHPCPGTARAKGPA